MMDGEEMKDRWRIGDDRVFDEIHAARLLALGVKVSHRREVCRDR